MSLVLLRNHPLSYLRAPRMLNTLPNGSAATRAKTHTLTALKRWSCDDKELPSLTSVKSIHIYDFDNTLFATPLPNRQVWTGQTIGQFQGKDIFVNGGWWHDSNILASTGEGVEKEEPRAWQGWWNEDIVTLVELSMQQKDALNVLLTGRAESQFGELIKRMIRSKNLDFHMVCLKPAVGPANEKFSTTLAFKQELLSDIVYTYKDAEEIRIYEDRVKHVKSFREFFFSFNKALIAPNPPVPRKPIQVNVIQVPENATSLDPVTEVSEVQRMINAHNTVVKMGLAAPGTRSYAIKRSVFYTGYLIPPPVTEKLTTLVDLPANSSDDIRYLANSILITPRACPQSILDKVGGIGKRLTWRVTGISVYDNKLWAARVEPVPKTEKYYSENATPTVVLALRRGARPADAGNIRNWQPVPEEKSIEFETIVGEKAILRIEEEHTHENGWTMHKHGRRAHHRDDNTAPEQQGQARSNPPNHPRGDDRRAGGQQANYRGGNQNRGRGGARGPNFSGRNGRGGFSRSGNGRGRNRNPQYKSLDDVGEKGQGGPGNAFAGYDESLPYNSY